MLLARKKYLALLLTAASLLFLVAAPSSFAQDWHNRGPMGGAFRGPDPGRWWNNPRFATQIGLTDAQKKQMDDILQQHKLQLIDLNAALEKQQVLLRPLIQADQPDEQKVLSQIDAIAQARANLEKANARMLFAIRRVLTPDQWKKVQTMVRRHRAMMGRRGWDGQGPGHSPGPWRGGPRGPKGPRPLPPNGPPPPGGNEQPAPPPSGPTN